jgi:DNA helicase-2/ATP-dependent DNA helicase PcrA
MSDVSTDNDRAVSDEIAACLDGAKPKSFFLFAGAGSGKTRALVDALKAARQARGDDLRLNGQKIGVITFTNAACDEIKSRLQFDSLLEVSTIHSFAWTLIQGFDHDIREWLRTNLAEEIAEHQRDEAKGRKGTKASAERLAKIASKTARRDALNEIPKFRYSPTGSNEGRDSLNHAEVIKLVAAFLEGKPAMARVLIGRFPILLVDESQDTHARLVDALFKVQARHRSEFCLGLFGDMMQRIYTEGRDDLGKDLPSDWATPEKRTNYRCPKRVIALINRIRSAVDTQFQEPRAGAPEGVVRLFILPGDTEDKSAAEEAVARKMAEITGDPGWGQKESYKSLTLEHRMAAGRLGFKEMFVPLHEVDALRSSLLDGSLPAVRVFAEEVLPLVKAHQADDQFGVAEVLRGASPLLTSHALAAAGDQSAQMKLARDGVAHLMALWEGEKQPSFFAVAQSLLETGLLELPDSLRIAMKARTPPATDGTPSTGNVLPEDELSARGQAIETFLQAPFAQVEAYRTYISGKGSFDTHQGVKGREFARVMVIMDDGEARGFTFKYDKLFASAGDNSDGATVASTRRLFYVTCSRAEESLALVAYTPQPTTVRDFVVNNGWFVTDEVLLSI